MATRSKKRGLELRLTKERLFYCGMALLITFSAVIGFGPSWFLRGTMPSPRPLHPLAPLVIIHATAFTAWMALFITQAGLISARQHKLHMRLGMATVGLAAAMVVLGLLTAARQAMLGSGPPSVPPLTWFAVPFFDMAVFSSLVAGGYAYRRDPQAHKRLMLCATCLMLQPSVGRMPFFPTDTIFGQELSTFVAFLLATPLLAWDLTQRARIHWATMVGLGLLAGEQAVRLAIWKNAVWLTIAADLVGVLS